MIQKDRLRHYSTTAANWTGCAALAFCLLSVAPRTAQGATLASEQALMGQLQHAMALNVAANSLHREEQNLLNLELAHLKQSVAAVQSTLTANTEALAAAQKKLGAEHRHLVLTNAQLAVTRRVVARQVRTMYENGTASYLSVLVQANSWSDFLSRMQFLILFAQASHAQDVKLTTLLQTVKSEQQQTRQTEQALRTQQAEQANLLQADRRLEQTKLNNLSGVEQSLANDWMRHGQLESQLHLTEQQIQEIQQETTAAETKVQNKQYIAQTTASMTSISVPNLISFANRFLGTPYYWGGTSPSGFDCSGFVQYVFAREGISLPRTSEEQFATGVSIPESALQPGDLVFFSTYAPGATHVGIYIGNGLMIDAQDYGVSIDNISNSYWGPKYIGARQVVKSTG